MKIKLYENRFPDLKYRNMIWIAIISSYLGRFINPNDSVLDIGCGFGEFINNVNCKHKYGLDIDGTYKKHLDKNVIFIKSASDKIKLNNNSVDKIFISNVFEHLTRKTIERTVIESKRVLKVGGEVIVLQPNIRFCSKDYWMYFDHITPIDDRALTEVFLTHGFIEKFKVEKFLPFTTKSKIPKHPILIRAYFKFPVLWQILGKQSLLVFRKTKK